MTMQALKADFLNSFEDAAAEIPDDDGTRDAGLKKRQKTAKEIVRTRLQHLCLLDHWL